MISSLLLVSAGLLATPVFISEVKATREEGHLRVDVVGDGGIDPEGARTKLDNGILLIYLGGTRVRADNRAWDLADGTGEIRAHRHRTETELVVPLAGNGCAGPVELTGTATGISALVGCDGSASSGGRTITTLVDGKKTKILVTNQHKLKALVELPPAAPDTDSAAGSVIAGGVAPVAAAQEPPARKSSALAASGGDLIAKLGVDSAKAAPAAAKVTAPESAQPAAAKTAGVVAHAPPKSVSPVVPLAAPSIPGAHDAPASASSSAARTSVGGDASSGGSSLRAVAVPALLLGGLALAAYLFARRRRVNFPRHIQILETVSLGPKRSLIYARVGHDNFVLGSSEAGITLLNGAPGPQVPHGQHDQLAAAMATAHGAAAKAEAAEIVVDLDQPIDEALADIPEPDGRGPGGGLRLSHVPAASTGAAAAAEAPTFTPTATLPGTGTRGPFRAIEGGLAGLFERRGGAVERFDRNETPDSFEDILEDTVEDQELRRKLAAGMSARVR